MQHTRVKSLAAVAALSLAAGCGSLLDADGCTTILVPGIVLRLVDSATGAPVVGGIVVAVREGAFADTARGRPTVDPTQPATGATEVPLVFERAGTYELTVVAPGYRPWRRAGVRVRRDECHVRTERVTALLQRAP